MLVLLIVHLVAALAAPLLVRWWGPRACYPLALAPAAAFGWALARTPAVGHGGAVVETYPWIRQLGLDVALRLTTLSWLMTLLIGGVGALVLVYSARYFSAGSVGLARFAAVLVAFAGAMLGAGPRRRPAAALRRLGADHDLLVPADRAQHRAAVQPVGGGPGADRHHAGRAGHAGRVHHARRARRQLPLVRDRRPAAARRRVPGDRGAADPRRGAVQVGGAAVQLLAAGGDGGAHPGQRLPARRRHGQGRRLPGRAARAGARHGGALAPGGAGRRPGHHAGRRLGGAAADRPQAAAGVRHGQPARPAGHGDRGGHPGRRPGRGSHAAGARAVQGGALPGRRRRSTTAPAPAT